MLSQKYYFEYDIVIHCKSLFSMIHLDLLTNIFSFAAIHRISSQFDILTQLVAINITIFVHFDYLTLSQMFFISLCLL